MISVAVRNLDRPMTRRLPSLAENPAIASHLKNKPPAALPVHRRLHLDKKPLHHRSLPALFVAHLFFVLAPAPRLHSGTSTNFDRLRRP
jgi:hypothetical protein